MDLNDVNKVGSRKKMNIDAEKLREKVSRETAKIIKLKVSQDTAYWDLKEKLQQVETNYEKLQQNMVEVQMQHEAISGQYQEELRLRHDTLNKVSSSREICGVLQEYSERLRDTLSRCMVDQAALCEAYQRSEQLVRDLRTQHTQEDEKNRALVDSLQEKARLMSDHQNQLVQVFTAARQQANAELGELRRQLKAADEHKEEMLAVQNELRRKLDLCNFDIDKKEQMYVSLQAEMTVLKQTFHSHTMETEGTLADQDKQIKELKEENQSLKHATENQDQFIKSICEQKQILLEKIAVLEDEHLTLLKTIDELKINAEDSSSSILSLQKHITTLNEENQNILQQLQNSREIINNFEGNISNLQAERTKLESEKEEVEIKLNKTIEESNIKAMEIEKLSTIIAELESKHSELKEAFKNHQEASDAKNKELNAVIETKDTELSYNASTISKLMSELKTSSEIRTKLEGALQKIKKEIEIERDTVREKERNMTNTIGKLESVVRDKDDEISKQLTMILEMRSEKERLQEKIQSMQNTIDNIQKELTRPDAQPHAPRTQPEHPDDNAVMLTPLQKKAQIVQQVSLTPVKFAVPRAQENPADAMLYSLFSDSSMEGDVLDMTEVNRRYNALARGERLSPAPLASLKRRGSVPAAHGGLRHKPADANDTQISATQDKSEQNKRERTFFKNKKSNNKPKTSK